MVLATEASAGVISFSCSLEFSGGTAPVGTAPWLVATFDDGGSAGSVTLTLSAAGLTASEFVTGFYANLDPALDPSLLVFSAPTKAGSLDTPTISLGANSFKADGGGRYDLLLDFATSGEAARRFSAGDSIAYTITGIPTLTAASFDFLSQPSGGNGIHPVAAHVQGIDPGADLSGWVSVPEPGSLVLLAAGGLAALRRRRR